jgi:hypothetical protein
MIEKRLQQAGALQSMKQRIESARTDPISVMLQLLHHPQPEDRLVRSVEKHVNSNETVKELPLVVHHTIEYKYKFTRPAPP